jgi:hypothetical protein
MASIKIGSVVAGRRDHERRVKRPERADRCRHRLLEGVMNSVEKPHRDADSSVNTVLRRSPVFRISKPFLSKFITPSSNWVISLTTL